LSIVNGTLVVYTDQVELYNHTATGFGWSALENRNLATTGGVEPALLVKLSAQLRAAWGS
jgi:hypothetical protein